MGELCPSRYQGYFSLHTKFPIFGGRLTGVGIAPPLQSFCEKVIGLSSLRSLCNIRTLSELRVAYGGAMPKQVPRVFFTTHKVPYIWWSIDRRGHSSPI